MTEQPSETIRKPLTSDFRVELTRVEPELVEILRGREKNARVLMTHRHGIILGEPYYKSYHGEDPELPGDEENFVGAEGEGHINKVASRIVEILQTSFEAEGPPENEEKAQEREEMLVFGHYIGQIHDLVQNNKLVLIVKENGQDIQKEITGDWKKEIASGKKIRRVRAVRDNENDTIAEELTFMDEVNEKRRIQGLGDLFNDKHRGWVSRALTVTIPGWNGATVFQPELKSEDTELTHATAWADLKGGIFMDGWEQFFKEGDLNLLEDNPDIQEIVLNPEKYPDMIEEVGARIREWRSNQIIFARAQWEQLQDQISRFPKAENLLRERVFKEDTYNDTFKKVSERAERDKVLPALELLVPLRELILEEQRKYTTNSSFGGKAA